ncbi:alpha/beta fold hydrolase [Streptomyces sp. Tu 3180]|uniref:thioesterase II family protein n=1 Tax=Streptomyces sp. Tu 3180 TaxID=2682611 RepID=UPI00135B30C7|nr:alpha/beta fold hydrolase [Streptomyces sp. Tu 3180]KAF3468147.1 thioesterase [Streptomyces sp. Tu 3180]
MNPLKHTSRSDATWFRRHPPSAPTRTRLLCLPYAGGSASFFHSWGHAFGDDVEVLAARYPGRQERIAEPCLESMEEMADAVTAAVLPLLDKPLALFGHSMGASLAYEVAVRLERRHGFCPSLLLVSAQRPPHGQRPRTAHLDGEESVLAEVRRLGGTDAELLDDPDLRDLVMPALRADFAVVGRYAENGPRPAVPVRCPVVGYVGDRDPNVTVDEVAAWADVAPKGFDLKVLRGDHFYLVPRRDELVADVASRLR